MPGLSIRYNRTSTNGNPGAYIAIESQWKDGDIISFKLRMDFRMTKYSGEDKVYQEHYALEYGPILMAYVSLKGDKDDISLKIRPENIIKNLKHVPGKPLYFYVNDTGDFEYMPYFEVQDEPFKCFP